MVTRELNLTPSFASEIQQLSKELAAQLWEKISFLLDNPVPDGKVKKKLKTKKHLYRMRIGQYRLFYTFGETWVRLLTIRRRDGKTYAKGMSGVEPEIPETIGLGSDLDGVDVEDDNFEEAWNGKTFEFDPGASETTQLPVTINRQFLEKMGIEAGYFPELCSCTSEEALLEAAIPSDVLEKVLDQVFPKSIDDVAQEPSLVVGSIDDLAKFACGDLVTFLLKLDAEQARLVKRALKGPTLVKGGAGTGKSTVALYRVKTMLESSAEDTTLLFTTFTRALTTTSKQLLEQLLTAQQLKRVTIETSDHTVRKSVSNHRELGNVEKSGTKTKLLTEVRKNFTPSGDSNFDRKFKMRFLKNLSNKYLLEEFDWIITGRNISTLDEYLETTRQGRKLAFTVSMRRTIWALYTEFQSFRLRKGLECYAELRKEAYGYKTSEKDQYDFIIVDEAQDLTPVAAALHANLCKSEEGIFFAADTKQSIYNKGGIFYQFSPKLNFRGRTAVLKNNYRSTEQIDRAAFSILGDQEILPEKSVSRLTGTDPICLIPSDGEEIAYVASYLRQMCKYLRINLASSAVLVPTQKDGESVVEQLAIQGIDACFYPGSKIDLSSRQVKVMTLHSAKGLEFHVVCLVNIDSIALQMPDGDDEFFEWQSEQRRLLYVGMTRAMRGLLVVKPQDDYFGINAGLESSYWHAEEVK